MKYALGLLLVIVSVPHAVSGEQYEKNKKKYRDLFMQQAEKDYGVVINNSNVLKHKAAGRNGNAGVNESDVKKVANMVTDCHMETLALFPEDIQNVAYRAAEKGSSYKQANYFFTKEIERRKSLDSKAAKELLKISVEAQIFAQQCIADVLLKNEKLFR